MKHEVEVKEISITVYGKCQCVALTLRFPSCAVSSYLSSLRTLELHIQVHHLCTNNKHNTYMYLDPPLSGFGRKALTHVQGDDYFIPTKFGQHQSIGSVRKALCSHTYTCISDPPNPSVT